MSVSRPWDKLSAEEINSFRNDLLKWYDRHRRTLPWRAQKGQKSDPYHVWLSEIMLQQTVVAAVIPYFLKFTQKWPNVHDLARASQDEVMNEWAGLGYYARARNLHKCAIEASTKHKGLFPKDRDALQELPGIGEYTSAAIMAIAFDQPASVVDGNVERVMARYFNITKPLPEVKPYLKAAAGTLANHREDRPGDYAQALMDLGATICIPKAPRCVLCPLQATCHGKKAGSPEDLPRKAAKKEKPKRRGYIYWVTDGDNVLVERRKASGLLGGTLGFPTTDWSPIEAEIRHNQSVLKAGRPQKISSLVVKHSFTHFDLELQGFQITSDSKKIKNIKEYQIVKTKELVEENFPTVFRKFLKFSER